MHNVDPAPPLESLPCRGCTMDCPNRSRCDGKPWRIPGDSDRSAATSGLQLVLASVSDSLAKVSRLGEGRRYRHL